MKWFEGILMWYSEDFGKNGVCDWILINLVTRWWDRSNILKVCYVIEFPNGWSTDLVLYVSMLKSTTQSIWINGILYYIENIVPNAWFKRYMRILNWSYFPAYCSWIRIILGKYIYYTVRSEYNWNWEYGYHKLGKPAQVL